MTPKTKLDLDQLAVDSFETTSGPDEARGTVHAHDATQGCNPTPPEYPCTCAATCLCKTAYYHCGTGPHTIYSCDYTYNGSCTAAD